MTILLYPSSGYLPFYNDVVAYQDCACAYAGRVTCAATMLCGAVIRSEGRPACRGITLIRYTADTIEYHQLE